MRISEHILSVALFGFGLGLTTAYAFDGTKSPANIAPVVGGVAPEGAPILGVGPARPDAFQAFQTGAQALRAGDTKAAVEALEYAARNGEVAALWKLGRMYLDGQGIAKDPKQARRWLFTAAGKGQYEAQAVLGAMLFRGQSVPRDAARGLMWLILARDAATPKETWITDLYNAAVKQATEVERNVALVHVEQWIEQSRGGQRTP